MHREKWLKGFLKRFPELRAKTTVELERERSDAMSPDNVARHFARVQHILKSHGINEPTHVFNLDECGFSVKGMTWGRKVKRIVADGSTCYMRTIAWQGSLDHVTMMAVVNAACQSFTPCCYLTRSFG